MILRNKNLQLIEERKENHKQMKGELGLNAIKGMESSFEDLKFFIEINFSEKDRMDYNHKCNDFDEMSSVEIAQEF